MTVTEHNYRARWYAGPPPIDTAARQLATQFGTGPLSVAIDSTGTTYVTDSYAMIMATGRRSPAHQVGAYIGETIGAHGAARIHVRRYRHRRTGRYLDYLDTIADGPAVGDTWAAMFAAYVRPLADNSPDDMAAHYRAAPLPAPRSDGLELVSLPDYDTGAARYYAPAVLAAAGHGAPGTETYSVPTPNRVLAVAVVIDPAHGPTGIGMSHRGGAS